MFRALLPALLIAAFTRCPASAQAPIWTGDWVGRVYLVPGPGQPGQPLPGDPGKLVYRLTLRTNGTYLTVLENSPDKKRHTTEGTWTRKGATMTLTVSKRDGKPDRSEPRTRILNLSKDGKSISTQLDASVSANAPKGVQPPKVLIVFKRK